MDNNKQKKKVGRPKKSFDELNVVTKRKKVNTIHENLSLNELVLATELRYKKEGHLTAAKILKMLNENANVASQLMEGLKMQNDQKYYTKEEALALSLDMKLSKRQYTAMYEGSKERNTPLYPPYTHINQAKTACYLPKEDFKISEMGFEIKLQSILDLTTNRLLMRDDVHLPQPCPKLVLMSKWGFDGASSQSQYKQKFQNPQGDDSSIFMASLVPIFIYAKEKPDHIYWKNNKPSSTTLCRPLRLTFERETDENCERMYGQINEEIADLHCTIVDHYQNSIEISHVLVCSMVDGKICNVLTNTSSQSCFICGATPINMNVLSNIGLRTKMLDFHKFGLATLHAWIRFLECVLHISYNLPFKKWSARTPEEKIIKEDRKKYIQNQFWKKMGLKVDMVKQGHGTTNDGNTARRFFQNFETSAEITGFDVNLMKRFVVILQTMASGEPINVQEFAKYAKDTAIRYVELYNWYYMPATVHKILIHGSDIIDLAIVPIGQLSEEVQESRHKEVRRYREHNTRKMSREKTNEDLLHSLLVSSDPYIQQYRKIGNNKKKELLPEAKALLTLNDDN